MPQIEDLQNRVQAAFLGALAGERIAGAPAAAGDLLEVATSVADRCGYDEADLRQRGLARASQCGAAGLLLRAIPFGLLTPFDRPRLRRDAYRVAALTGTDEGTAVAAVATAILVADLTRFEIDTALVRLRQSLLEDAPFALLERLYAVPVAQLPSHDEDPGAALQIAVSAIAAADSVESALGRITAPGTRAALSIAGALAGIRFGLGPEEWRASLPQGVRAVGLAETIAAGAVGTRASLAATEGWAQEG